MLPGFAPPRAAYRNRLRGFNLTRSHSEAIAHKTRKGFNLIEAAIVLAVVGAVLGGIWVAASAVSDHFKVSQTAKDVLSVCDSMTRVFYTAQAGTGRNDSMATIAANANILPENWVQNGTVNSPISKSVIMSQFDNDFYDVDFWGSIGGGVAVYLIDVPQKYCHQLLGLMNPRNSGILLGVETGPDFWDGALFTFYMRAKFPYSGDLRSGCGSASTVDINFHCRRK